MGFNIINILGELSKHRFIFHSEADFQHALAWEIHKIHPQAIIRLEVPSGRQDKRERIDILVTLEYRIYAIELKYKKTKIQISHNNEIFDLKADSAQDISRYDYIKDIVRLERYVSSHPNSIGYAVMLTNDDLYWKESKSGVNSEEFFLNQGRELNNGISLNWHVNTADGTKKERNTPHNLKRDYIIHWEDYSVISQLPKKNKFKYLLLEV